jgi:hypothetical protein
MKQLLRLGLPKTHAQQQASRLVQASLQHDAKFA